MQSPLTPSEKRKLKAWAAKKDKPQLACRVTRGSHWWPDITDPAVKLEWDQQNRRYNLVAYCARGCGCKVEYPVARRTGRVDTSGSISYAQGYAWTEAEGNPGGPMSIEAKGIIRAMLLEERLQDDGA